MKVRLSHFNSLLSLFIAVAVCGASIATESVARADVLAADAKACAALENKQFGPGRIVAATFVRRLAPCALARLRCKVSIAERVIRSMPSIGSADSVSDSRDWPRTTKHDSQFVGVLLV